MSQTLASDFIQKGFNVVSERMQTSRKLSSETMQGIVLGCRLGWTALEQLSQLLREAVDRGIERRPLLDFVRNALGACDRGSEIFNQAKQRATEATFLPEEAKQTLATLEDLIERSSQMHNKLASLQAWLEKPRHPVALASLPDENGDPHHTGYLDLEELKERMLLRGD